jgi:hypothetical protein
LAEEGVDALLDVGWRERSELRCERRTKSENKYDERRLVAFHFFPFSGGSLLRPRIREMNTFRKTPV